MRVLKAGCWFLDHSLVTLTCQNKLENLFRVYRHGFLEAGQDLVLYAFAKFARNM